MRKCVSQLLSSVQMQEVRYPAMLVAATVEYLRAAMRAAGGTPERCQLRVSYEPHLDATSFMLRSEPMEPMTRER